MKSNFIGCFNNGEMVTFFMDDCQVKYDSGKVAVLFDRNGFYRKKVTR